MTLFHHFLQIKKHKNRLTDQWNRIENPEINIHKCVQLIFDYGEKSIQWRKLTLYKNLLKMDHEVK